MIPTILTRNNPDTSRKWLLYGAIIIVLGSLVYLPGISGPFVFDDRANITDNSFIKIDSLDIRTLSNAAFSMEPGPLKRPIPMLSFAINYYFAGSFRNTLPYKLTNLVIHITNGLLVFWLVTLIFRRLEHLRRTSPLSLDKHATPRPYVLGAAVALLWVLSPIHLTSVLYIVQRMASLSALFVFSSLICYLKGRNRINSGDAAGMWLIVVGPLIFGTLGIFSKETAVLIPVFVLLLEFTLFPEEPPWDRIQHLNRNQKRTLAAILIIAITIIFLWLINYAINGYGNRPFSFTERILTEPRVLFFYISLILLPRIDRFGIFHDDIDLSRSFLDPWTTLPAILGILALLAIAIYYRKRHQLLSLGILWFFTAHLLESTIFALEIVHEHRNYIATLGPLLVAVFLVEQGCNQLGSKRLWAILVLFALLFGGTTTLRAWQWSSSDSMHRFLAEHHPESARSQAGFSTELSRQGRLEEALAAMQRAAELDTNEPGYLVNMHVIAAWKHTSLSPAQHRETLRRLERGAGSPLTSMTLEFATNCVDTSCASLQKPIEQWFRAILDKPHDARSTSHYQYLLGRTLAAQGRNKEAMKYFQLSHNGDHIYLHPLFAHADLLLKMGRIDEAKKVLQKLRKANKNNPHPRDREIEKLSVIIQSVNKRQ